MTTVYVAGRTKRIPEILKLYEWLEAKGFALTFAWAREDEGIEPPFRGSNSNLTKHKMRKELVAASEADIFILLSDPGIRGAYIELGSFLNTTHRKPHKRAFIVGGEEFEHSFEALDSFRFVESIEKLKDELGKV